MYGVPEDSLAEQAAQWPVKLPMLGDAERFLIDYIRRFLEGGSAERSLEQSLRQRFGLEDAGEAAALLQTFVLSVGHGARRSVRYHPSCASLVSADELILVNILAAAQTRHAALGKSSLDWLIRTGHQSVVVRCATGFAAFLRRHDLELCRSSKSDRQTVNGSAPVLKLLT